MKQKPTYEIKITVRNEQFESPKYYTFASYQEAVNKFREFVMMRDLNKPIVNELGQWKITGKVELTG